MVSAYTNGGIGLRESISMYTESYYAAYTRVHAALCPTDMARLYKLANVAFVHSSTTVHPIGRLCGILMDQIKWNR